MAQSNISSNTEMDTEKLYDLNFWIKLLAGPVIFFLLLIPDFGGLSFEGQFSIALYCWLIAWWIGRPIPWGITSLLPIAVLPLSGVMDIRDITGLYGQRLLFFHIGVLSFGYCVHKTGLGKRIALKFLRMRWVGTLTLRILFFYLLAMTLLSAFIDNAPVIAIGIPIGIAIVEYAASMREKLTGKKVKAGRMKAFVALGVLYAAEAGGIMTVSGVPHTPAAIAILESTVGQTITYVQWSMVGVILGLVSLVLYFLVLRIFYKPEFSKIEAAQDFFEEEEKKLGQLSRGELNTLVVFVIMLALWLSPIFIDFKPLSIWVVPVIGVILLYLLPAEKGEGTLVVKDLQVGIPWNIVFLALCGAVMAGVTQQFGVINWVREAIPRTLDGMRLAFVSGFASAGLSNFISGVATVNIMSNIFFPVAAEVGFNPAIIARILPAAGMAIIFPWAGAATGTAFATGAIKFLDMIKVGIVATIIHIVAAILLSAFLVPLFNAFTVL